MNIGQNWKLDKNENWTKKWKLDKIGQYWKRQMVKLENRSVEARCRCSRFKKITVWKNSSNQCGFVLVSLWQFSFDEFSMKLTTMEISRLQTAKSLSLLTKMRFNAYFWSPLEDDSDLPPLTWPLTRKTTPKPPSAMVSSAWTTCRPTVQDPPWK